MRIPKVLRQYFNAEDVLVSMEVTACTDTVTETKTTPAAVTTPDTQRTPAKCDEPELTPPELYAYGRLVTEHHVREMLTASGEEDLQRYERGEISTASAYHQARTWLRNRMEMFMTIRRSL